MHSYKKSAQTGGFLFIFIFDIHFNNLLKYLCRDELSRWGVETRALASGKESGAPFLGVFFVLFLGTINTPDHFWSGGHVNILNKQHNSY